MRQTVIFALGDSITYGFPYGPRYSWVKLAGDKLDLKIINGGSNGDTVSYMLRRLSDAFTCFPSHLILLGGANDAFWGKPAAKIAAEAGEICQRCINAGVIPILGLPTPVDETKTESLLAEYRHQYLELSHRYSLKVIPFHEAFTGPEEQYMFNLTTDGCHPSIEGYEAMAEVAEKYLPQIL